MPSSQGGKAKAENKTHATAASVDDFIAAIADDNRRKDCLVLAEMMQRVTGFASRKPDFTVYIVPGFLASEALMGKLGKHKTGMIRTPSAGSQS